MATEDIENPSRRRLLKKTFGYTKNSQRSGRAATDIREKHQQHPVVSRRNFLVQLGRTALITAGALGGAWGIIKANEFFGQSNPSPAENPKSPVKIPQPEKSAEQIANIQLLNQILNTDPDLGKQKGTRYKLEENYVARAYSLDQIDQGFIVIIDPDLRFQLLQKRWKLRTEGKYGLYQLTPEESEWADSLNLDRETVAICIEARQKAKKILEDKLTVLEKQFGTDQQASQKAFLTFIYNYRPDLVYACKARNIPLPELLKYISLDELLPNEGGMVRTVLFETESICNGKRYGFINIGKRLAKEYFEADLSNKNNQKALDGLINLCGVLSEQGFKFDPTKVVGGAETGDIGLQFRPDTAWEFYQYLFNNFQLKFNPFSLEAVTHAYIFFFHALSVEPNKYRFGYVETKKEPWLKNVLNAIRKDSIAKWNNNLVNEFIIWSDYYWDQVIKPRLLKQAMAKPY